MIVGCLPLRIEFPQESIGAVRSRLAMFYNVGDPPGIIFLNNQKTRKNYKTYYRSARVQLSNQF